MKYMLQLYADEAMWGQMTPEQMQQGMAAYAAYTQALHDAGVFAGGDRLEAASTSTTIRVDGSGKTVVHDGPYAETKEQLGGFYLIDVPDLDTAIQWAARCPGASHGTIDVRPVFAM